MISVYYNCIQIYISFTYMSIAQKYIFPLYNCPASWNLEKQVIVQCKIFKSLNNRKVGKQRTKKLPRFSLLCCWKKWSLSFNACIHKLPCLYVVYDTTHSHIIRLPKRILHKWNSKFLSSKKNVLEKWMCSHF